MIPCLTSENNYSWNHQSDFLFSISSALSVRECPFVVSRLNNNTQHSCWFSLGLDLFPSLLYMNISLDIWCNGQSEPLSPTCLFLSPGKQIFFQIFPRKIFHFPETSVPRELTTVNPEGFSCPCFPGLLLCYVPQAPFWLCDISIWTCLKNFIWIFSLNLVTTLCGRY